MDRVMHRAVVMLDCGVEAGPVNDVADAALARMTIVITLAKVQRIGKLR